MAPGGWYARTDQEGIFAVVGPLIRDDRYICFDSMDNLAAAKRGWSQSIVSNCASVYTEVLIITELIALEASQLQMPIACGPIHFFR